MIQKTNFFRHTYFAVNEGNKILTNPAVLSRLAMFLMDLDKKTSDRESKPIVLGVDNEEDHTCTVVGCLASDSMGFKGRNHFGKIFREAAEAMPQMEVQMYGFDTEVRGRVWQVRVKKLRVCWAGHSNQDGTSNPLLPPSLPPSLLPSSYIPDCLLIARGRARRPGPALATSPASCQSPAAVAGDDLKELSPQEELLFPQPRHLSDLETLSLFLEEAAEATMPQQLLLELGPIGYDASPRDGNEEVF
eukprot:753972-Hanusia_phi.AAC.6